MICAAKITPGNTPEQEFMGPPKLVIFGGNGFVGSRVCEEALKTGLSVVSVNRSGPPKQSADWIKGVEWVKVSLRACQYRQILPKFGCYSSFCRSKHPADGVCRQMCLTLDHGEIN